MDKGIFKELGIENISDEQKGELLDSFTQALQNNVTMRIMDMLTDTEKQELDELSGKEDDTKVQQFIRDHIPQIDTIAAEEYEKFVIELKQQKEQIAQLMGQ